jgi:hypothetical protein
MCISQNFLVFLTMRANYTFQVDQFSTSNSAQDTQICGKFFAILYGLENKFFSQCLT